MEAVKKVSDFNDRDVMEKFNALDKVQAIIEFNLDGTIIQANDNFLSAVGYSLEDIKGKHHKIFCENDYTSSLAYRQFWDKLSKGEFDSGEYKRISKSGKEIWINASYNPVFDDNGKPYKVIKFATDITASKMQNAEFEGKINAISRAQAVIEFNLDGTIVTANENFLKTFDYSMEELKGKHHRMFCDPTLASSMEYKMF